MLSVGVKMQAAEAEGKGLFKKGDQTPLYRDPGNIPDRCYSLPTCRDRQSLQSSKSGLIM